MASTTFTTVQDGLILLLEYSVNKIDNENLELRLFSNDATISEDTILTDLVESTNYTYVTLDPANFTVNYSLSSTRAEATYGVTINMPITGSDTIYGAYLTTTSEARLVAATKFGYAREASAGDVIQFTSIVLTLDN